MKNIIINNLPLRKHKHYKIMFKFNMIKDCLKNNSFILFFYYDFLNSKNRNLLKKQIKDNNLKIMILKKNSIFNYLSKNEFKFLNNILNDNIILVFNQDGTIIDQKIIQKLNKNNNLNMIGCLWNKKFYRPTQIKKYSKLNNNIKLSLILLLKNKLNDIRYTLTNLKK